MLFAYLFLAACSVEGDPQRIIDRSIQTHGGAVLANAVVEFEQTQTEARLFMSPNIDRDSFVPQDAWLATVMKIARDIYRPDFNPMGVCLRRPHPGEVAAGTRPSG